MTESRFPVKRVEDPQGAMVNNLFGLDAVKPLSQRSEDEQATLLKGIEEAFKEALTYREGEILRLYFGLGDGYAYTAEEISRIFKVTENRIRQIASKAIRKLQHPDRAKMMGVSIAETNTST